MRGQRCICAQKKEYYRNPSRERGLPNSQQMVPGNSFTTIPRGDREDSCSRANLSPSREITCAPQSRTVHSSFTDEFLPASHLPFEPAASANAEGASSVDTTAAVYRNVESNPSNVRPGDSPSQRRETALNPSHQPELPSTGSFFPMSSPDLRSTGENAVTPVADSSGFDYNTHGLGVASASLPAMPHLSFDADPSFPGMALDSYYFSVPADLLLDFDHLNVPPADWSAFAPTAPNVITGEQALSDASLVFPVYDNLGMATLVLDDDPDGN